MRFNKRLIFKDGRNIPNKFKNHIYHRYYVFKFEGGDMKLNVPMNCNLLEYISRFNVIVDPLYNTFKRGM